MTIHRPGVPTADPPDEMGNPVIGPGSSEDVLAIAVAPLAGDETADKSVGGSVNGYTLYLPFGTEVGPEDMVTVRGVDGWHVEADATKAVWASPFTSWTPGTVAIVRRAS